ncbi:MAG TPA: LCP family protein [Micromonosporaceae bacterium]|nr:LCP family protein [Micromonosporaceae bacterium]
MIEEELRAAFARHEELVPDAGPLRRTIERLAVRRRRRRLVVRATGAALAVLTIVALPSLGRDLVGARPPAPVGDTPGPVGQLRPGPLDFLVLGLDRAGDTDHARADTIIVAHVPASRDRVYLIAIPRDVGVQIPPYAKSGYPGGLEKINAAYFFGSSGRAANVAGGVELTALALRDLTGLRFDGAAVVEFEALRRVTDAVGGVRMCLDREIVSVHTQRVFRVGCQRLDGAQALDLIRQRRGLPRGDLDRLGTAQDYLAALAHEFAGLGAGDLFEALGAAGGGLTVDTRGVPLPELVFQLRGAAGRVIGVSLMTDLRSSTRGGVSFLQPDPALSHGLFDAVRRDALGAWLAAHPELVRDGQR